MSYPSKYCLRVLHDRPDIISLTYTYTLICIYSISSWTILYKNIINKMSEEEAAFDNWEEEAEIELTKEPEPTDAKSQTVESEVAPVKSATIEKVEFDPHQVLMDKLNFYRGLSDPKFDEYLEQRKSKSTLKQGKTANIIMKNDKDFIQFAKSVGERFREKQEADKLENLSQNDATDFVEEVLLLLYSQLEWKNIDNVKDKLKIIKKEKKEEEARLKKQREKEQRQRRQAKEDSDAKLLKKVEKKEEQQEDIFGGATLVNSKQKEEELKNKVVAKVEVQEDDDDFM